ncbi:MAG: hypothetical protein ABIG42_08540, partial [bacterium]
VSNNPEISYSDSGHSLLGIWEMSFDPETLEVQTWKQRDLAGHINITSWLNPVIQVVSYDQIHQLLSVNVTLTNPFSYFGYDVRAILFTNNEGLRLINSEAWTDMYDVAGGYPRNPFVAFAKSSPLRRFDAFAQHTENLQIHWPSPTGPIAYAIDVSFPTNCAEPYKIDNFTQTPLLQDSGSTCDLTIKAYDWQNDITNVKISALPINGVFYTSFTYNSGLGVWECTLVNSQGAAFGDYECLVFADSNGFLIYDYVTITVDETGCDPDDNQNCLKASPLGMNNLVSGCVDSVDLEDWYEILSSPNGITGGTVDLEILSGNCYLIVYGCSDAEICPGSIIAFANNVILPPSSTRRYYARVFSTGDDAVYRISTSVNSQITNVACEIFVATSGAPNYNWPIWERPGPDVELTTGILIGMIANANNIWHQYGYNMVWDGTATEISSQYYILNSPEESTQMHTNNGRGNNKICLYFVDVLNDGVETAYCVPSPVKSNHNVHNVYTVYSPNVWYWEIVVAHEEGHNFGYLLDQYLFEYFNLPCGDTSGFPPGVPDYLYSDPKGCYLGNLMDASVEGWGWEEYDLTNGQENYVNWFQINYPTNFPWY